MLASEMVAAVRTQGPRVACLVDLPPSRPSKTRYVVHRLRAAAPDFTIVVCRWSAPTLADDDPASLIQAGANHVSTSLADTRNYLRGLAPAALARTEDSAPADELAAALPRLESPSGGNARRRGGLARPGGTGRCGDGHVGRSHRAIPQRQPPLLRDRGLSEPELLSGLTLADIAHPDDSSLAADALAGMAARADGVHEMELRHCRPDSGVAWARLRGRRLPDASGRSRVGLVAYDVSAQKTSRIFCARPARGRTTRKRRAARARATTGRCSKRWTRASACSS